MRNLIAQQPQNLGDLRGIGTIGLAGISINQAVTILARVLSSTIGLLTVIGIIYFLFVLITGAIGMITSEGDKGNVENARRKMTTGVVGVIILVAAMFIMDLIAKILGIPSILNLQEMINRIRLG